MPDTLFATLDRVRRKVRALLVLQAVNLGLTVIILVWVWCCR
jgi:hypothetical protein